MSTEATSAQSLASLKASLMHSKEQLVVEINAAVFHVFNLPPTAQAVKDLQTMVNDVGIKPDPKKPCLIPIPGQPASNTLVECLLSHICKLDINAYKIAVQAMATGYPELCAAIARGIQSGRTHIDQEERKGIWEAELQKLIDVGTAPGIPSREGNPDGFAAVVRQAEQATADRLRRLSKGGKLTPDGPLEGLVNGGTKTR